jgi:hypothetical protein
MGIYERPHFRRSEAVLRPYEITIIISLDQIFYHNFGSGYIVKEYNVALSRGFRRGKAVRSLPAGRLALYECIISSLTVSPSPKKERLHKKTSSEMKRL